MCVFFFLCAARKSLSPVLDSSSSLLVKRRSPEEMEKDLRGAEAATELSLHPKEGLGGTEGQYLLLFKLFVHTFRKSTSFIWTLVSGLILTLLQLLRKISGSLAPKYLTVFVS